MTLRDINMTLGVRTTGICDNFCTNLSANRDSHLESKPRGEVTMTPKPEGKKHTEPHTPTKEEEERKNQIFRSTLRERVL